MTYLIALTDPQATDVMLAGQKAATLAQLYAHGFPVPAGVVVTTKLCEEVFAALLSGQPAAASDLRLPDAFDGELQDALSGYSAGQRFAVRSSSPEEDSSAASFAGQFDTYLDCQGIHSLKTAILKCLASLWSSRAIAYRQFHGIGEIGVIAILIQEMVDCDVSGVAFSIHPVSGDLTKILINAHTGLGSAVVDGEAQVQEYVVCKEALIADLAENKQADAGLLGPDDFRKIGAMVVELEQLKAFPQDVEWGIARGQVVLLQSRPVTAFPPAWSRERSAERFPYPVTPLIWEVVEEGFHRSLRFSFNMMGLPPFAGRWFSSHNYYIYFNSRARDVYLKRTGAPLRHLRKGSSGIGPMLRDLEWLLRPLEHWDRNIDIYLDEVTVLTRESLDGKGIAELWSFAHRIRDLAYRYFAPNIAISQGHSILMRALTASVIGIAGPDRADNMMLELTLGCNTKTGLFNDELKTLAVLIAKRPRLESLVRLGTAEEALVAILADGEASVMFERFLAAHHHREIDHFLDPYYPSWGEKPLLLIDSIKRYLDTPGLEETDKSAVNKRYHEAITSLLSLCPESDRANLLGLVELTRTYVGLDDTEHYQTSRLHTPTRRCFLEIGRRLVAAGVLEEERDLCFASFDAIDRAVAENIWDELCKEVYTHKEAFSKACSSSPSWILEQKSDDLQNQDVFVGLACSSGVAEGPARIVRTSDDFGKVRPGDILFAPAAPPTWTALFYSVAAVVTEGGGALSHGAVIAREVGIPAVMGLPGIVEAFEDGDIVRVDGGLGYVSAVGGAAVPTG